MSTEEQFFLSLRAVVIHMIKHVEPLYDALIPVLQLHESGEWRSIPTDERKVKLEEMARHLEEDSVVTKYFASYPHQWARDRFARLKTDLEAYRLSLK